MSNIINVGSDRIGSDIIDIRSDLFSPDAIGGQAALAWSHQSWLLKPGWARAGLGSTKVALGLTRLAQGEVASNLFRSNAVALTWIDTMRPGRISPDSLTAPA